MKKALCLFLMLAIAAGCGGAPKDIAKKSDLTALGGQLSQQIDRKVAEEVGPLAKQVQKLDEEWTSTLRNLPKLQLVLGNMEKEVGKWEALRDQVGKDKELMKKMLAGARADMRKILEAEEKLLAERLASLREVLQELRAAQAVEEKKEEK